MNEYELEVAQKLADKYAPKFSIAYLDEDDIRQEILIICIKALEKGQFNGKSSLETYLTRAIINRLSNVARQYKYRTRSDCECGHCKFCVRRVAKQSLTNFSSLNEQSENMTYEEDFGVNEVIDNIEREIPPELRKDYLRMKNGDKVKKERREMIEEIILEIYHGR